ncbi:hypothetical protein [Paraburkholderia sp. SIMBA_030]
MFAAKLAAMTLSDGDDVHFGFGRALRRLTSLREVGLYRNSRPQLR